MQIAEAAPPLQSGGRFREPGENFGMTSPASSIRGPRSRAQRIVPTCYRRHRRTRDMVNTGGITVSTAGISPEQSTVYARRTTGAEEEHLHCRRAIDCITFLREGEEGTSTPIQ